MFLMFLRYVTCPGTSSSCSSKPAWTPNLLAAPPGPWHVRVPSFRVQPGGRQGAIQRVRAANIVRVWSAYHDPSTVQVARNQRSRGSPYYPRHCPTSRVACCTCRCSSPKHQPHHVPADLFQAVATKDFQKWNAASRARDCHIGASPSACRLEFQKDVRCDRQGKRRGVRGKGVVHSRQTHQRRQESFEGGGNALPLCPGGKLP